MYRLFRVFGAMFALVFMFIMRPAGAEPAANPLAASPGVEIPATETYTMRDGVRADWLWNRFRAQGRPAHEWPAFWKEACAASDIPCTEEAWRRIPAGTVITIPRDPKAVAAEVERLRIVAARDEEVARLTKELLATYAPAKRIQETMVFGLALLAIVLAILAIIAVIVLWRRAAKLARTNQELRVELTKEKMVRGALERESALHAEFPGATILPARERDELPPKGASCCGHEMDAHGGIARLPDDNRCPEDGCTQGFRSDGTTTPADGRERTAATHDRDDHAGHRH